MPCKSHYQIHAKPLPETHRRMFKRLLINHLAALQLEEILKNTAHDCSYALTISGDSVA